MVATGLLVLGSPVGIALAQTETKPKMTAASGEVDLRPKFRKGQEVRFAMDLNIVSEQGAGESQIKSTTKQQIGLLLRVKEVANSGAATVDLVYESLKFETDGPTGKISFDSAKPKDEADTFDGLLRSIVGLTLTLQTDETGNITSVNTSSGGDNVPAQMLQQFTGADLVRGLFGPITNIKSGDGRAKVGETWTNESSMTGAMGTTKIKTNYTLNSHRSSRAEMGIQGSMSLDGSSGGIASVREGSISGNATWNTEAGMLEKLNMTQNLVVDTQLSGQSTGSMRNTMQVGLVRK